MRALHVMVGMAFLALGCGTPRPMVQPAAPGSAANPSTAEMAPNPSNAELGSDNPTEAVPLEVEMTDQNSTGRVMHLRGRIVNPHAEKVEGVRVQLVFLAPREDGGAQVLEIQQKELTASLAPGESTLLRWDVESLYLSPGYFALAAYPKRLGDRDLPPPDHWKE